MTHDDDIEFEFSGIYDEYGNAISANSAVMSSEWQPPHGPLPTREEMWANHGRIPRIDLLRPEKVPPEPIRLVAEILAGEAGYELADLVSAVRPGRPSAERAARRDALARIVLHFCVTPSGSSEAPAHWQFHHAEATLEDIGTALGGLRRDAVLRLRDHATRLEVAKWRRNVA